MIIREKSKIVQYEVKKRIKQSLFPLELYLTKKKNYLGEAPLQLLITGVPRSGTSFITGFVVRLGLSPGPEKWLKSADSKNKYGYFECMPLFDIMMKIMEKSKSGFYNNFPIISDQWLISYKEEIDKINKIIKAGGIEVYKENKLLVYADFYHLIFPNVKWLFIERNFDDVYQSQFGGNISKDEFKRIYDNQLAKWHSSVPSKKALYVKYGEFKKSPLELATKISSHLDISPSEEQLKDAISFFKPSK